MSEKKRLLFFCTIAHRNDLALRLDRAGFFEVYYITLKRLDKLDLLADNPGLDERRVIDLPTLYKKYDEQVRGRTFDDLATEIRELEGLHAVRTSNLLVSYNFDRSMYPTDSYHAILRRIWSEHQLVKELLLTIRPDLCVGELSRSYMVLMYEMCRKMGIAYMCPAEWPKLYLGKWLFMHLDTQGRNAKLEDLYRHYRRRLATPTVEAVTFAKSARALMENRERLKARHYTIETLSFLAVKLRYRLRRLDNWLRAYRLDVAFHPEVYAVRNPILNTLNRFLWTPLKVRWANSFQPGMLKRRSEGERYVYFPLLFYPEMSSNLWAADFVDYYHYELHCVQLVSRNLPTGYYLYVKEHLPMMGRRRRDSYKILRGLYNVRLFHGSADTFDLMKHAELVLTISGTTGIEAFALGKRVLTFAGGFYREFDSIQKVDGNRGLAEQIAEALSRPAANEDDVFCALAALYDYSCRPDLGPDGRDFWYVYGGDSLSAIAEHFEEFIGGVK